MSTGRLGVRDRHSRDSGDVADRAAEIEADAVPTATDPAIEALEREQVADTEAARRCEARVQRPVVRVGVAAVDIGRDVGAPGGRDETPGDLKRTRRRPADLTGERHPRRRVVAADLRADARLDNGPGRSAAAVRLAGQQIDLARGTERGLALVGLEHREVGRRGVELGDAVEAEAPEQRDRGVAAAGLRPGGEHVELEAARAGQRLRLTVPSFQPLGSAPANGSFASAPASMFSEPARSPQPPASSRTPTVALTPPIVGSSKSIPGR